MFVSVAVTGHTVVYHGMVSVVTWFTGQLVTSGAQDVMVYTRVVYTVLVVQGWAASVVAVVAGVVVGAGVFVSPLTGQTVVYRGMVSVVT